MTSEYKIKIIKSIVVFALIVFVSSAETSLFPYMRIMGVVPSALMFIVAAAAVFEGPSAGLAWGAVAGFFADGAAGLSFCYYTIFMTLAGAFIGSVSSSLFRKRIPTAMVWGALFWFFCEFFRFFFSYYLFGKTNFTSVFTIIFPGLLYSTLVSPIVIFPISRMYRKMKKEPGLFR